MAKKWMVVVAAILATMVAIFALLLFLPKSNSGTERILVKKGDSISSLSRQLDEKGLIYSRPFLVLSSTLLGRSQVRPGQYRLPESISTWNILQKLAGNPDSLFVRIPEGSTFADMRAIINQLPHLEHETKGLSTQALLQKIDPKQEAKHPEGLFFPDTYEYTPGMSDVDLYKTSYKKMQGQLQDAWDDRQGNLPYKTPYELLIMASIIEREVFRDEDRAKVARVFYNRLKMGMQLQSDANVAYAVKKTGTIWTTAAERKNKSPYNTYLHKGLPPGPICSPGLACLKAAANPEQHDYIYFVARGEDGSHVFSTNLAAHNKAVREYWAKRRGK